MGEIENKRIFEVIEHYLVEIDETNGFGSHGTMTRTYTWEVFIAVKGFEYRGKAYETNDQKREIPWMTLEQPENGLEIMIKAIERRMNK